MTINNKKGMFKIVLFIDVYLHRKLVDTICKRVVISKCSVRGICQVLLIERTTIVMNSFDHKWIVDKNSGDETLMTVGPYDRRRS